MDRPFLLAVTYGSQFKMSKNLLGHKFRTRDYHVTNPAFVRTYPPISLRLPYLLTLTTDTLEVTLDVYSREFGDNLGYVIAPCYITFS